MADEKKKLPLSEKWESLSPKRRQQIALVGVLGGVTLVSFILLSGSGGSSRATDPAKLDAKVVNTLLPDGNARDIGMSGLANDVEGQRDETETLKERLARMEELQKQQNSREPGGANRSRDDQVRAELEAMQQQLQELRNGGLPAPAAAAGAPAGAPAPEAVSAYGGIRNISNTGPSGSGDGAATDAQVDAADSADATAEGSKHEAAGKPLPKMYLPSGSVIQGVMLTGLDAPTGKGALKDPVPVLVRIQKDAILPNRYRADVRECFALIAGQGDLASERAYLRSETISCVRHDKQVIDMSMKAYAVDTDGKAGLRGRLVSKQGSVLSKAILASFADGVSQAFKGRSPALKLDNQDVQPVSYDAAGYNGAIMGASSSLDRIAKYYLDLADQLFPILEIDAGREVTLVLVKGLEMHPVR